MNRRLGCWLAVLLAAIAGWMTAAAPIDLPLFAANGRAIVTGHWSSVYGGTENQAGPVQDVLAALLTLGGSGSTVPSVVTAAINAAIMLAALALAHRGQDRLSGHDVAMTVGVLLWLVTPAFWRGHPIEALIPVCWLAAARVDREQRSPLPAGLLLALSAAVAPWGVLGWPCVLRRGHLRRGAATLAAAGVFAAAMYGPFLLAGRGHAVLHRWPVVPTSGLHLLLPRLATVGWTFRIVQAVLVLAVAAACAWRWTAHPARAALVACAAVVLRIASDPLAYDYYWVPAGVASVVILASMQSIRSRDGLARVGLAYLVWTCATVGLGAAATLACLLVVVLSPRPRMGSVHANHAMLKLS